MSRNFTLIPHFFNNLTYNRQYFWSFLTKTVHPVCFSMEKSTVFILPGQAFLSRGRKTASRS